ncbi:hypothetical protein AAG570_006653 [Ranatra chinensis]|uniref:Ig-like domain-containing protein n=1 Tax=Ranatra chinensis TaxID=642074 RepID=A0ABD0YUY3_9HEMI
MSGWWVVLVASVWVPATLSGSGSCPPVCTCKWKGGKQTVECTDRALIALPEGIDSETQVLDVSGNDLQILPRENFVRTGLLNLQRLYLRNCRLGQIDDRALRGLTNLVELDLSSNLLTSVPSATFQDVPFLRDLTLANNPIQKIESRAFKTVPGLVKLDLSHCALRSLSPGAFEGVELLESLKLNGNELREIRPQTVEALSRLHGVELHDNPWYCDCRLRAAKLWLARNNIPYPIAPTCSGGPERIARRSFAELDPDDFACRPEIRLDSRHVETLAGDNATITCRVESVPEASVNWYWNGRLLLNNSAFSSFQRVFIRETGGFEKRSTLIVTNAQESDSGDFYCVAENRAGNAEANYTLHVLYRMAGVASLGGGQIAGLSAALVVLVLFILLVALALLLRLRRAPFSESKTPARVEPAANGVQKPSSPSASDPDLINDTREEEPPPGRPPQWEHHDRAPIVPEGYPPDYGLPIPGPPHHQPSAKTLRVWQRGVPVLPPGVSALKRVLTGSSPDEGYQEGCGTDV